MGNFMAILKEKKNLQDLQNRPLLNGTDLN